MSLKESERKSQLQETVTRHLTGLLENYRFPQTAKKSPSLARDLLVLCYEELKSELFLMNFPIRSGEILSLFDEFFKGSYRDFYLEIIQLDLELYFITLPDEAAADGKGVLEETVEEETRALKKVYRDLLKQPSQYLALQEKTFSALLQKLEEQALAPDPDELFRLFRANFPGVDEVYFKSLGKFRNRIAALPEKAKKAAPPPVPERREEPRPAPAAAAPAETPAVHPGRPQSALLFRDLVEQRKLPPQQYYVFIKARITELERHFGSEQDYFHQLIFSLHKASQKFRDKLEQLKAKEMDEELINAGYLNAALSIAFAKSAEGGGMRGQNVKISVG